MLFRRSSTVIAWPPGPLTPARLNQCLVLAVLLHLLLVAVIGNTPGGTARLGEGVWGSLNSALRVTLAGPRTAEPEAGVPRPPEVNVGAVGMAPQQRYGGAVRREPAPPIDTPGAAKLGRFSAQPADGEAEPIDSPPTRPKFLPVTEPDAPRAKAAAPSLTTVAPLPELAPLRPAPTLPVPLSAPPEPVPTPVLAPVPATVPTPVVAAPDPAPAPAPAPAPPAEQKAVSPPEPAPAVAPAAAPVERAPIAASPTPRTSLYGTPDAGQNLGHDVATAPSTPASAPRPKLDLSLPRGGLVSSRGSRGMLELMPHPPERKNKVEEGIETAAKADCRKAYSELGVLAAVPLAIDAARDKGGCKW